MRYFINTIIVLIVVSFFSGCSTNKNQVLPLDDISKIITEKSQLQIRQYQTKRFFNTSKEELLNIVLNTMQDEQYFVSFSDIDTGLVSAKGRKNNLDLEIVVLIETREKNNFDIRLSLNILDENKNRYIEYEKVYQYLFERIRKSFFLEKQLNKKKTKITKVTSSSTNPKKIKKSNLNMKYTIQLISAKNKTYAEQYLQRANNYSNPILKVVGEYFVVRVGIFDGYASARLYLDSVKKRFDNPIIVKYTK